VEEVQASGERKPSHFSENLMFFLATYLSAETYVTLNLLLQRSDKALVIYV
jgi:hypothetical protein